MSKREIALLVVIGFLVFVLVGINKKFAEIQNLSVTLGVTKKQNLVESMINFFLIGIGVRS